MADVEYQTVARCDGPCLEVTPHHTIRSVARGLVFLKCRRCGTVHHIQQPMPWPPGGDRG